MYDFALEVDVDKIEAISINCAVSTGLSETFVGSETPEVTAPCFLRAELEALAGRDITDCPELGLGLVAVCTPCRLIDYRCKLNNAIGTPIPTTELFTNHIKMLGECDGVDGHFLSGRIEDYFVVAGLCKFDVLTRLNCGERSTGSGHKVIRLCTIAVFIGPGEVVTDLEATGDVNHRAGPDAVFLCHDEVLGPGIAVDFTNYGISSIVLFDEDGRAIGGVVEGNIICSG